MLLGTPTVTLSLKRYDELIAKETVYEIKRQEIMHSKYATNDDKRLFNAFAEEKTDEDASDICEPDGNASDDENKPAESAEAVHIDPAATAEAISDEEVK